MQTEIKITSRISSLRKMNIESQLEIETCFENDCFVLTIFGLLARQLIFYVENKIMTLDAASNDTTCRTEHRQMVFAWQSGRIT